MKHDVESQQFKSAEPQTSYNSNCLDLGEMLLPYECRFSKVRSWLPPAFPTGTSRIKVFLVLQVQDWIERFTSHTSRTVFNNKMFFGIFSKMLNSRELVWKRWLTVAAQKGLQRELPSAADDFPGTGAALLGARSGDVPAISSLLVESWSLPLSSLWIISVRVTWGLG